MKKLNILFIAYEFPPEGTRGTKRITKFLSYITEIGVKAFILTVKNGNYEYHDSSLINELPKELSIYRAYTFENIFYGRRHDVGGVIDVRKQKEEIKKNKTRGKALLLGIYHTLGKLLKFPDSRILWLPSAVLNGVRIINKNRIDAIYASGPSFTNHLVASVIKLLCRKPLIIDFRDAWASDPARKTSSIMRRKIIKKLEKYAVTKADKIISTTNGITSDFKNRYSKNQYKFNTITHGYDKREFQNLNIDDWFKSKKKFTIVHAGTLGWERTPLPFIKALGKLVSDNNIIRNSIEVIMVGQNTVFKDGKNIEDYIKEYKLNNIIKLTGFVSRKKSLEYMLYADLLLLIIGSVPKNESFIYGISAKIYDYAAAKRPVLTISENGASAKMAKNMELGSVVNPDDTEKIINELIKYFKAFQTDTLKDFNRNDILIDNFDYRQLTKQLKGLFEEIIV
ncbi:glycosyltransferase [Thermodesulfobacteriota bacterium]